MVVCMKASVNTSQVYVITAFVELSCSFELAARFLDGGIHAL